MKNYIILLILSILPLNINAQIINYSITEICNNVYDKDMQSFTGWSSWRDNKQPYTLSFSPNAFKCNRFFVYINYDENNFVDKSTSYDNIYVFSADMPSTEFKFCKKATAKYIVTVVQRKSKRDDLKEEKKVVNGTAIVYSTESYDNILSGNSTGIFYVLFELEDGSKENIAYKIKSEVAIANDAAAEQRQIEQEEAAAERERLKREKRSETINSLGSSIIKLLKK